MASTKTLTFESLLRFFFCLGGWETKIARNLQHDAVIFDFHSSLKQWIDTIVVRRLNTWRFFLHFSFSHTRSLFALYSIARLALASTLSFSMMKSAISVSVGYSFIRFYIFSLRIFLFHTSRRHFPSAFSVCQFRSSGLMQSKLVKWVRRRRSAKRENWNGSFHSKLVRVRLHVKWTTPICNYINSH